ncbi:hypothetical protein [Kineosporia sp. NBRC 101731]|uniref:hypothetical protein n=1 Tax=Kineosporia sp. NBRC 101731 TaxID=3032199 RepID=UPI0024A30F10|nr:hypothetical protein [Kineosporia sp. NBRC 101731]GLY32681.1 hypothetical protein Kisp02_60460 [Kineosporia sp. NBRC 101731]
MQIRLDFSNAMDRPEGSDARGQLLVDWPAVPRVGEDVEAGPESYAVHAVIWNLDQEGVPTVVVR